MSKWLFRQIVRSGPRREDAHCTRRSVGALLLGLLSPLAWAAEPLPLVATPPSARDQAPMGLDGYWVAVVTQDWRFRMVVPGKGEFAGIPLNLDAKQFSDKFDAEVDTAAGKACEAYGAPALMRIPERLHISWQDGNTLRIDTDSGMQTRLLRFDTSSAPGERSLQGYSQARWRLPTPAFGPGAPRPASGTLSIVTSNLQPGLLRKNGVPYSDRTTLQEY